ncbi:hypothetical protein Tco_1172770 [Tanacetum coccineum]
MSENWKGIVEWYTHTHDLVALGEEVVPWQKERWFGLAKRSIYQTMVVVVAIDGFEEVNPQNNPKNGCSGREVKVSRILLKEMGERVFGTRMEPAFDIEGNRRSAECRQH